MGKNDAHDRDRERQEIQDKENLYSSYLVNDEDGVEERTCSASQMEASG